jgi:hypothetical protein
MYAWAMRIGHARLERSSMWLRVQHVVAERLMFAPLRDQLGVSKLRRAYTGGAALGPDTLRFFRALGVNLLTHSLLPPFNESMRHCRLRHELHASCCCTRSWMRMMTKSLARASCDVR